MDGVPDGSSGAVPRLRQVRDPREVLLERSIRDEVFIKEQKVPLDLEFENEGTSVHFLLWVIDRAVGCGRYRHTNAGIKLERVAVLKNERGNGYGKAIVNGLLDMVRDLPAENIYLNSQTSVSGFYEKCGFRAVGETFMEAGIEHVKMVHGREGVGT